VPDVVAMPPAVIEVEEFAPPAVSYRIHFWMRDYARQERVRDVIMTSLWYAFRRHAIAIPYPIQDVHLRQAAAPGSDDTEHERRAALRQVDFLADLDDAEIAMLRSDLQEVVFGSDEIICREGDPGDAFFILRRGAVEVVANGAGGQEAHVADLSAPAFFGEMALLTGEPRAATVRAKGDAELLVVDRSGFEALFKTRPSVAAAVSRVIAHRQTELRERREQPQAVESSESRSRRLLAKMQAIFRFRRAPWRGCGTPRGCEAKHGSGACGGAPRAGKRLA
jgi:CRP-like cAMP-binding protein